MSDLISRLREAVNEVMHHQFTHDRQAVHALQELIDAADAVVLSAPAPTRDLYAELADALGCDPMDSHAGRLARAQRLAAQPTIRKLPPRKFPDDDAAQPTQERLPLTDEQINAAYEAEWGNHFSERAKVRAVVRRLVRGEGES